MVLGLLVLALLVLLVLLQSSNLWKSFTVETASDTLLLYGLTSLNVAAFVVFGFIFLRSIVKLMRERRALELGSKIKSRLLFYFALISLLPIIAMAVFSYLFMNRALDRWFTQIPENVVREAEKIQEKSNADQFARLVNTGKILSVAIGTRELSESELERIAREGNLAFIEVIDQSGKVVAHAGPVSPDDAPAEFELIQRGSFNAVELSDGSGVDVSATRLDDGRMVLLGVDLRQTESVNSMFEGALVELDRLKQQQFTVRQIGLLTLGVLTFLLIFASSWTAFYIARGITVPIKALAEGAERIAQGDLGHQVGVVAEDELALLVWTFNEMSSKLEQNASELTERRRYIETVLLSLPTGVISIDPSGRISTINPSAKAILDLEPGDFGGVELMSLIDESDRESIQRLINRAKRTGHASDNARLAKPSKDRRVDEGMPVAITATALPEGRGVVLVIEDLSDLIAAQRATAWQEVARRMAHEIKNPLTPIQLSAERIAKRFSPLPSDALATAPGSGNFPSVAGESTNQKIVREGTDTIIREVQSLKAMVDEFSRFARLPEVKLESGDVNEVIHQAADLYGGRTDDIKLEITTGDIPMVNIDSEQLKRVFINLIDNAIEAPGEDAVAMVSVRSRHDVARDLVVVEVADNGRGIESSDLPRLFQPYFSTKGRGTGLGLAIVHRILTEHRGRIKAVPNHPRGAKFIIELPAS